MSLQAMQMIGKKALLALMLLIAVGTTSFAQSIGRQPTFDASFGWQMLHSFDINETFPWGIHFSGSGRITRWMGIAGDIGWNRQKKDTTSNGLPTTITDKKLTFAFGPRFYLGSGRVTAFAHALVGGTESESFFETQVGNQVLQDIEGVTSLLVQPGLGVDFKSNNFFGLRLQLDYQWIAAEDYDDNVRFIVAAVLHLY